MHTKDLEAIQKRAIEEGIPYQTLIASLLHKYVSRRLVERKRNSGLKWTVGHYHVLKRSLAARKEDTKRAWNRYRRQY